MARTAILPGMAGLSSGPRRYLAATDAVPGVPSVAPARNGPVPQPQVALRASDCSVKAADAPLSPVLRNFGEIRFLASREAFPPSPAGGSPNARSPGAGLGRSGRF
ncbi:MAG: hypothetical protein LBT40_05160 [Deltaproteobacteria bacterium]|nr:hypothetical protein [Deltaproteobacteria bacterium]